MKDRTKKLLLNIAMVATIVVMVVIAVVYVGNHKGWFSDDSQKDGGETVDESIAVSTVDGYFFDEEPDEVKSSSDDTNVTEKETTEETVATDDSTEELTAEGVTETTTEQSDTDVATEQSDAETTTEVTTEEITTTESTLPSKSCTITIQCTAILNNMDKLKEGKEAYVPSSGYILSVTMDYTEGETVFDVLTRACSQYGVQLEYAYTPMYGSYYIEGINHLYEFDCGGTSGWKYSVNGSSPNYGCSNYTVCENDSIVWYYVCE